MFQKILPISRTFTFQTNNFYVIICRHSERNQERRKIEPKILDPRPPDLYDHDYFFNCSSWIYPSYEFIKSSIYG